MVGFFPVTTFEISFLLPGLWAVYIRSLSLVLRCSRTYQIEDPEYSILRIMLYFRDICTRNSENTPQLGVQLRMLYMLYEKLGVGG